MKNDYTDITIVLDRSGSMGSVKDDTIGGVNHFLETQKKVPGEATFTLVQFDDQYDVISRAVPIAEAKPLTPATFQPRGSTALLDAIGRTIDMLGSRLGAMKEAVRPSKVIFVIVTDGHENASKEYTKDKIDKAIAHQREVYKWDFIFLGANQDAIATAASLSIPIANSITYAVCTKGVADVFGSLSANVASYRSGVTTDCMFLGEDRKKQEELLSDSKA